MNPTTSELLMEIETCALAESKSPATCTEYVRMVEHFAQFVARYEHDLLTATDKHVRWFLAHLLHDSGVAQKLTAECAYCQASNRRAARYSESYAKRHLAALKVAYEHLVKEGFVDRDPAAYVKRPSVQPERQYVPSTEEVKRLFDYPGTARSRLLVRLAYYAPARRAELASLRWADIDENGVWRFTAKLGKQHGLKLHPEVMRALRHYRRFQEREAQQYPAMQIALADPDTAYVFLTRTGKQVTPGHLVRMLKRHAVHAGVGVIPATAAAKNPRTGEAWDCIDGKTSKLSPHALRRAWASHAMNDGERIDVISSVLNHTNIETTRRHYAFTDDDRVWDALTKRRLA